MITLIHTGLSSLLCFAARFCDRACVIIPNMKKLTLIIFATLLTLGLMGCAGTPTSPESAEQPVASNKPAVTPHSKAPPEEPEKKEIPIPDASVYPLLAAEFALREREFETALALLSEQMMVLTDPEVARRTLRLAEFMKKPEQVLPAAARLAELDPADSAAVSTAMAQYIHRGDNKSAMEFAKAAKARGSRINAPALLTGFADLSPNGQASIAGGITALATEYPDDTDISLALALLERELGNPEAALKPLNKILTEDPAEERALIIWTQVQLEMEAPKAFDKIDAAVEADPENERLRLQYARLLGSKEHYDEARAQFRRLLDISPLNDEYLMALALLELELNETQTAREHLQTLLNQGQRVEEAEYYLGRISQQEGEFEDAIEHFSQVGDSREFMDAKRRAGTLILEHQNVHDLRSFMFNTRSSWPSMSERLYMLEADLLRTNDQPAEAIETYTAALTIFPESRSLLYGRAILHEGEGDIPAMESDMRRILAADPNNTTTLNALGYALTNHTERFEEALALIERANELSPGDPAIMDSLGWAHFKLGNYDEALRQLKTAYGLFPDPEVAAHLGEVLWATQQEVEAKFIWRQGLERDPQSSHIQEAMERAGISAKHL